MDFFEDFNEQECTFCGECFHQCPVMSLPKEKAKDEMKRLVEGQKTEQVLENCTSCFACNLICPHECNPTQLILERWNEKYLENGLPKHAEYFLPHNEPNFRRDIISNIPKEEKKLVQSWDDDSYCKEIFYPGCNVITAPYLTQTSLLEDLEIRGSLDLCCGEMYYRMGLFERVKQTGAKLEKHFNKMGLEKMVIPCTAGLNMFTNVLPRFSADFDFEVQHMLSWILDRIDSGEIEIKNEIDMKVTIQESCHGKIFGDKVMDLPRKILEKIGTTVIEEKLCREKALCCGIASGFSPSSGYHPVDYGSATIRSLKMAQETEAEAIVTYCAGCLQMLSGGQILYPLNRMPIYHILELLQKAIGETPKRRNKQRGRQFFLEVLKNQFPKLISRKRIHVEEK